MEARLNTPEPSVSTKTPITVKKAFAQPSFKSVSRNLNLQYSNQKPSVNPATASAKTSSKVANNPIDSRKERLSARLEAKRASLKHVNALLKDVASNIKHEPTAPNRLISNIANNQAVKQNYKLNLPSNPPQTKRTSFIKFLERNTPQKLSHTELKLDLKSREEQSQRRIEERAKLMQEKMEISKKKREEKMRKINEIKVKKIESDLKLREELDAKQKEAEENKKRVFEEKRKEKVMEILNYHLWLFCRWNYANLIIPNFYRFLR